MKRGGSGSRSAIRRRFRSALAALALLALVVAMPVGAQPPPDPALLEELAARLLLPTVGLPGQPAPRIELLPGVLPPNLPLALPMPPGSRLIGSAVRTNAGPPGSQTDVLLDVPGQTTTVFRMLQDAVTAMGWRSPPFGPDPGLHGFQPVMQSLIANFCRGEQGSWLQLTVVSRNPGPNDVRFTIYDASGPCGAQPGPRFPGPPGEELVPLIVTPEGVTISRSSTLTGEGTWASFAVAESARGVGEIETEVARQLEAANWLRTGGAAGGPLAWSAWNIPGDGDWRGLLTVLEGPGSGQRLLQVQVAAPKVPTPFDGPSGP